MSEQEGESMSITKELREYVACWYHTRALVDVADRIDERFSRELTAKQDEVDALQAKLDVSMPMPLDADGVSCHIGDEAWCFVILWGGKRTETSCHGFVQSMLLDENGFWLLNVTNGQYDEDGTEVTETWPVTNVSHHAPKPETIEDVRRDADKDACAYFNHGSSTASCGDCPIRDEKSCNIPKVADLVSRAYECGLRDSCARGGYADPSVLGSDAS